MHYSNSLTWSEIYKNIKSEVPPFVWEGLFNQLDYACHDYFNDFIKYDVEFDEIVEKHPEIEERMKTIKKALLMKGTVDDFKYLLYHEPDNRPLYDNMIRILKSNIKYLYDILCLNDIDFDVIKDYIA